VSATGEKKGGKNIIIKTADEIATMHDANRIVADTLALLEKTIAPGISTWELDRIAEDFCLQKQAKPAFKGYRGFPGSLCVSINEEVVHGIPSRKRKLKKGDIVSIDFGVLYNGFYGDSAVTVPIGSIDREKELLLQVTRESLQQGIAQVVEGNRVGDVSRAVQECVERYEFSVVRQFVGHGIGASLHEPPEVPNYFQGERTPRLIPGMVLAIEPMVNAGTHKVKVMRDGWTVVTQDKKPSAHFEHSVAVMENGPLVLSLRESEL
jgi:methionyl aminopeptidase